MSLRLVVLACVALAAPAAPPAAALAQEPNPAPTSAEAPTPTASATRRLLITGRFERSIGLTAHWRDYSKLTALPWFEDPAVSGAVLLFVTRVPDVGGRDLTLAPQQPVCWCAAGGCSSLRVLSAGGECGRLESPGDGRWERHLSSSQWKPLGYADPFLALTMELPEAATAVHLSILAQRCAKGGGFMFPITTTHTEAKPGSPVPFYLAFDPHGSRDFNAAVEVLLRSDGMGAFDLEVSRVKMDDRDPASKARAEACVAQKAGSRCAYVSLEPDLDGAIAGVEQDDLSRCK